MSDEILDFQFPTETTTLIKVVGVGGGGGNAVNHMYQEGITDVSFALCNTDNQALMKSPIHTRVQLGRKITEGLGAGNRPDVATLAAEESRNEIQELLSDGTKMAFVTAGMGGGTGTGAAPVVAGIAKSMGILTVGIVTIPFLFEGRQKIIQALKGVEQMSRNVDALLVISNERLRKIYPNLQIKEAFARADDTLTVAAKGIADIIITPGNINLDFADVRTVLKDGGVAIMSSGSGIGEHRMEDALKSALYSPLLNNTYVFNAKKILYNIYSSEDSPATMEELEAVSEFMQQFGSDIEVIWGTATDNSLGEEVKITLLASGFGIESIPGITEELEELSVEQEQVRKEQQQKEQEEAERIEQLIKLHYGSERIQNNPTVQTLFSRPQPYILQDEDYRNSSLIDTIENSPVFKRDANFNPHTEKISQNKEIKTLFD